jgi:hypothetical protein
MPQKSPINGLLVIKAAFTLLKQQLIIEEGGVEASLFHKFKVSNG